MKTLSTFDQYFAAYAITRGVGVVLVSRFVPTDSLLVFQLDDTDNGASLALVEWNANQAYANAKTFSSAHRRVRRLMHDVPKPMKTVKKRYGENTNDNTSTR